MTPAVLEGEMYLTCSAYVTSVCCVAGLAPHHTTPRLDHGQHIYGLFVAVQTLTGLERAVRWGGVFAVMIQNISDIYLSSF